MRADILGAMRTLLAACAVVLLTSSCGGSGEASGATDTESAAPKVSTATTCSQLFDGDAPAERVVDLMAAEASTTDDEKAAALADELAPIESQAGDEIGPHVKVVETELRKYADVKAGESFETATMVTSLTELNNVCGTTPRF